MYVYLLVCLFAVVKFRVYVLIGSTRAPFSVFCVRVWCICPIKKGNEIIEHISAAQIK